MDYFDFLEGSSRRRVRELRTSLTESGLEEEEIERRCKTEKARLQDVEREIRRIINHHSSKIVYTNFVDRKPLPTYKKIGVISEDNGIVKAYTDEYVFFPGTVYCISSNTFVPLSEIPSSVSHFSKEIVESSQIVPGGMIETTNKVFVDTYVPLDQMYHDGTKLVRIDVTHPEIKIIYHGTYPCFVHETAVDYSFILTVSEKDKPTLSYIVPQMHYGDKGSMKKYVNCFFRSDRLCVRYINFDDPFAKIEVYCPLSNEFMFFEDRVVGWNLSFSTLLSMTPSGGYEMWRC